MLITNQCASTINTLTTLFHTAHIQGKNTLEDTMWRRNVTLLFLMREKTVFCKKKFIHQRDICDSKKTYRNSKIV